LALPCEAQVRRNAALRTPLQGAGRVPPNGRYILTA
jgi:hypothetical protein